MLDRLVTAANQLPHLVDDHITAVGLVGGLGLCLTGYVGWHWIERRRFYRRKSADGFPTYFKSWGTRVVEGNLRWLCLAAMLFGFLMIFAGIVDLIDG